MKARRIFSELTGDGTSTSPNDTKSAEAKSAPAAAAAEYYSDESDGEGSDDKPSPASTVTSGSVEPNVRRSLMSDSNFSEATVGGAGGSGGATTAAGAGADDSKQREDSFGGGDRSHSHSFSSHSRHSLSNSGLGKDSFDDGSNGHSSADAGMFDAMDADVRELERGKFADEPIAVLPQQPTPQPPTVLDVSGAAKPATATGATTPTESHALASSPRQSADPLLQRSPITYAAAPAPASSQPVASTTTTAAEVKSDPESESAPAPAATASLGPASDAPPAADRHSPDSKTSSKTGRRRTGRHLKRPAYEYSEEVVTILLNLLRKQNFRLVTLQLVIELITEMVLANRPSQSTLPPPQPPNASNDSAPVSNPAPSTSTAPPTLGSVPETGVLPQPPQPTAPQPAAAPQPSYPALTRAHLEKLEDAIRLSARVMRSRLNDGSGTASAAVAAANAAAAAGGAGSAAGGGGGGGPSTPASPSNAAVIASAPTSTLGNLALDMFEDEYHALAHADIRAERMIANSINLLPIESSALSGLPVNYRLPSGDVEQTRTAIQMFLLLRQLKFKLLRSPDIEFQRIFNDDLPIKRNDTIPIQNQDLMTCSALVGKRKVRFYLMIEHSLSVLMLVQRHPTRAGFAIVQMVVPLRHQEAFLNRSNACVLHITIRCDTAPHASCRKLKGGTTVTTTAIGQPTGGSGAGQAGVTSVLIGKPLWNLALLFEDRVPCHAAKAQLTEARIRLRREMIRTVISSIEPATAAASTAPVQPPQPVTQSTPQPPAPAAGVAAPPTPTVTAPDPAVKVPELPAPAIVEPIPTPAMTAQIVSISPATTGVDAPAVTDSAPANSGSPPPADAAPGDGI